MNSNHWDAEAESIMNDLEKAENYLFSKSGESYKIQAKLKSKIRKYQNIININFEKMIYLANPNVFLRPQEKTLLHWGGEFSEKVQIYCRELNKKIVLDMWGRLIQGRISRESSGSSPVFYTESNRISHLKTQRRKNVEAEKDVELKLATLSSEKIQLTKRYNDLVLTRANRDASGCLQEPLGGSLEQALLHPALEALERLLLNASLRIRRRNQNQYTVGLGKLNRLIVKPSDRQKIKKWSAEKSAGRKKAAEIENGNNASFDALSEKLMGLDPSSQKMRDKFATLQVKKSNQAASDISLIPASSRSFGAKVKIAKIQHLS